MKWIHFLNQDLEKLAIFRFYFENKKIEKAEKKFETRPDGARELKN